MDVMNLGNMKKKKGVTATPKAQIAQNAITNHSSNIGKKRVQGANGVGQGNQGWKSQYTQAGGGYGKQINPIINSLSNAPTYDTPKITDSLLTNKGFNQALGVVGARNNAKLKMQNQRVLQGVLGSLVSGDSQNRATANRANIAGLQDSTDRRGQDLNRQTQIDALAEKKNSNSTLKGYYESMTSNAKDGNDIRREEMNKKYPTDGSVDTNEAKDRRLEMLNNGGIETLYGETVWASMDSDQKSRAKGEYYQTGRIKDYESDNWLTRKLPFTDAEFKGGIDEEAGVTTPYRNEGVNSGVQQQGGEQQAPKRKFETKQINTAMSAYAHDQNISLSELKEKDGQIITPDGAIPIEKILGRLGNGNI